MSAIDEYLKRVKPGQRAALEKLRRTIRAAAPRAEEGNSQTMIVRRENDSSTWNLMAGAWNKARDAWINVVYARGPGAPSGS